jgi:predicted glycoside hydrolase/deacetylase ChbG (UPF0249 family)
MEVKEMRKDEILNQVKLRGIDISEIMCHPAYLDNTLLNVSSYTHTRLTELDILTTVKLPENLALL